MEQIIECLLVEMNETGEAMKAYVEALQATAVLKPVWDGWKPR
jgi:hypothetical protein